MNGCKKCKRKIEDAEIETSILEQLAVEHTVSEEVQVSRLQCCQQCPYRIIHTCSKCGCYIQFRTALKGKCCPIGLWTKEG